MLVSCLRAGLGVVALLSSAVAFAAEVSLAGVMGRRATLVIDGGAPQTLEPQCSQLNAPL